MIENPYKHLVIIAGGNSIPQNLNLKNFDNKFTFGLNHQCRLYDNFTVLVWLDRYFYSRNREHIKNKDFITITKLENVGQLPSNIIKLRASDKYYGLEGLKKGLFKGRLGGLVGLFAMSLGIALNFEEIYLLGYDMKEVNNKTHCHCFNEASRKHHLKTYKENMEHFNVYKGCRGIYNVSTQSAIDIFKKINYLEFTTRLKKMKPVNQGKAREWLRSVLKCNQIVVWIKQSNI